MNKSVFEYRYKIQILQLKLRQFSELIRDLEEFIEGEISYRDYDEELKSNKDEINELYSKAFKIAKKFNYPWNSEYNVDESNIHKRVLIVEDIATSLWLENGEEPPDESKYPKDIVDFYERSVPLIELM